MGKDTNKDREKMTPLQRERIQNRLEKRCADLNKRYPKNKYEVRDNKVILVAGRKRHKVSTKAHPFDRLAKEYAEGAKKG